MTFGSRLKQFAMDKFGSVKELAAQLKIADTSLSRYINGPIKPGQEILFRLAKLGCNMNWLMLGEDDPIVHDVISKQLKLLGSIPAGTGEMHLHDYVGYETIDLDPDNHELLLIDKETGDSMTPIFKPGDQVLVSYKDAVFDGCIVAAKWGGNKGAIKILVHNKDLPEYVVLRSLNQAEEPIFLKKKDVKLYRVVAWFDKRKLK